MADILIIEPDLQTGYRMSEALAPEDHACRTVASIAEGADMLLDGTRMMTVLNARLPWTESAALLRMLEERGCPVLFITSDAGNTSHLQALYQGACSVLLTPFDPSALREAVSELLTRTQRQLSIGALRLDADRHEATLAGEQLTLTAQEFALLHALMLSPDAALSREQLLRTAWGYQGVGETRTVDVHIQRLRRKLGPACIETVYKHGYRLKMA
ncbi:MAG: response regulator transcription factor [Clostridia bacterium]|nr:response regulator transcription factor [Clostridia bacterium]